MPEVQIPDEYNTFKTVVGLEVSDTTDINADANKTYDLLTRQTIPLVLLGRFVDTNLTLLCTKFDFVSTNRLTGTICRHKIEFGAKQCQICVPDCEQGSEGKPCSGARQAMGQCWG